MNSTIISPKEAAALKPETTLIFDCRHDLFSPEAGRAAYETGHLHGAYYLHLDRDLSSEIIPGKTGRHRYDDKGGGIAARLWWMLRSLGHNAVAVLDGGIQAWEAAGLELESGFNEPPMAATVVAPHLALQSRLRTCDRAQTDALKNDPTQRLIDSRTAPRYRGEHEPIDPIAGHIPGAINLPWPNNLENDWSTKRIATFSTAARGLRPATISWPTILPSGKCRGFMRVVGVSGSLEARN